MLPKPVYYAFDFLNRMGEFLLMRTENILITTDGKNDFWILCHNYKKPNYKYFKTAAENINAKNYTGYLSDFECRAVNIRLQDPPEHELSY